MPRPLKGQEYHLWGRMSTTAICCVWPGVRDLLGGEALIPCRSCHAPCRRELDTEEVLGIYVRDAMLS
jgi:hypothetical protein